MPGVPVVNLNKVVTIVSLNVFGVFLFFLGYLLVSFTRLAVLPPGKLKKMTEIKEALDSNAVALFSYLLGLMNIILTNRPTQHPKTATQINR